jgi:hypothetical protein
MLRLVSGGSIGVVVRKLSRKTLRDAGWLAVGLVAAGALAPASAAAVNRYVDAETGADANPACPQANPCDTIAYALANSGAGDAILIDSGSYPEAVTVGDGRSLTYQDFVVADGTGPAIVDGGANPAVTVAASGGGAITGLHLRSDSAALTLSGAAEVDSNTFDDPDANGSVLGVSDGANGATIHDNTFVDPAPSTTRGRAGIYAPFAQVEIRDNDFTDLNLGIQVGGPDTVVEGNGITQTHNLPGAGRAILVTGGPAVVRGNTITDAADASTDGIQVSANGTSLVRNEISGHRDAVFVSNGVSGVTLEGDRIWGNSAFGLRLIDFTPGSPQTSATATNITAVENGGDISVDESALTLDSSIVGSAGGTAGATCTITFSRADTAGANPNGCDGFQTTADPMLADPANGDLHLQAGSPMIDAGSPDAPALGAIDFDGDSRAVNGTTLCADRRDIGADEFVPASALDCEPPNTSFVRTPPKKTRKRRVRFKFEVTEPSTFTCQLDQKPPFGCGSPVAVKVRVGRHKFSVTATDNANNVEPKPARYRFRRIR